MKPIIPFALLGAFFAVGAAKAASTTPVGYNTISLPSGQFTFVGLTVHQPVLSAGVLTAESSSSVTAGATDFVALLGAPGSATYILELADGTVQEVTSWTNAGVLNTPNDITGSVVPNTTTYKLRKASTISDVFGATNSAGLVASPDGDFENNADVITLIGAGGAPTQVYYFNDGAGTQGWFTGGNEPAENLPIVHTDGFYIKKIGGSLPLVISGEVKLTPSSGVLINGFNFLSPVAPVGLTLASSGLKNSISQSQDGDSEAVDNVLIPQPNGSFVTCYYFNDGAGTEGWFQTNNDPADSLPLEGGFLILNRGGQKTYSISVPAAYSNL